MTEAAASPPPTDLRNTLEELRASVAARGARKELAGMLQEAILGFLECLMALLADFRAGKLVPLPPVAEAGASSRREESSRDGATPGYAELSREVDQQANSMGGAVACPSPSRTGTHFCRQKWEPVPGPAHRLESGDKPARKGKGIRATLAPSPEHDRTLRVAAPSAVGSPGAENPRGLRPAAFAHAGNYGATAAECAGRAPGFSALQAADSKNRVLGSRDRCDDNVPL
jgi:hypothetical protein